jgi:hypothetical protein
MSSVSTPSPHVFEINTRVRLAELGEALGRPATLRDVPDEAIELFAALGFDYLWLMGVWEGGPRARARALAHEGLRQAYDAALPGWGEEDVGPSPYAVAEYRVAAALGGAEALAHLRERLAKRGIGLLLDFVPNHLGLDHSWATSHPERFVCDADGHPRHGRDPYFPAWDDTLQLDYRRHGTRAAVIEQLGGIAEQCDGVRCDMAMLVLRDVFARTWGDGWQGGEFWPEAIAALRRMRPGFLFVAEAYWQLEYRLMELGFDYVYDKRLYDRLVDGDAAAVRDHLRAELAFQRRCLRFVENHDEPRAASLWGSARHRAAVTVAATVPGMRLFHQGQIEGLQRRLPVQLRRRGPEPADPALTSFYERLLPAAPRAGDWRLLEAEPPVVAWTWDGRSDRQSLVAVNMGEEARTVTLGTGLLRLAGRPVELWDRLSDERLTVDGDALAALRLELAPWQARLFDLR